MNLELQEKLFHCVCWNWTDWCKIKILMPQKFYSSVEENAIWPRKKLVKELVSFIFSSSSATCDKNPAAIVAKVYIPTRVFFTHRN